MSFPSIKQNVTLIISEHLVLHVCIVLGVNDEARIPLNVMAGQVKEPYLFSLSIHYS